MLIYIVRHAIAIAHDDPACPPDHERWLTEKGRKRMREAAHAMRKLGIAPSSIWSSPLARAQQTAEIVRDVLDVAAAINITTDLKPGGSHEALQNALGQAGVHESVMLVGHEPDLSMFASRLLTGSPDGMAIEVKKGSLIAIDLPYLRADSRGTLLFMLQPRQLREMG